MKLPSVDIQTQQHTSDGERRNGKEKTLVTSRAASSQSRPCPRPATTARQVCKKRAQPSGPHTPGGRSCPPVPSPPPPRAAPRRVPGEAQEGGGRVPSSATVAAQPDRRNLLARGHLWASGKSLSSSSGTDIQQQDGTTGHPLAPRLACHSARAARPQPASGGAGTISLARLSEAASRTYSLPRSPGLESSTGLRAEQQRESPQGFWEM